MPIFKLVFLACRRWHSFKIYRIRLSTFNFWLYILIKSLENLRILQKFRLLKLSFGKFQLVLIPTKEKA